jgi:uncharacterized membrane protein YagU involved in acid resistance
MYSTCAKIALFAMVCVPVRLIIALLPLTNIMPSYVSLLIMTIGLSFLFRTSADTFFGSEKYWSRLNHGLLYVFASVLMFLDPKYTTIVLFADLIYGIITVRNHYY